jgi:RNA polymerase sigma factor (sigma-70 family)
LRSKSKARDSTTSSVETGQSLQEPYASKQVIFECIQEQATPLLGVIRSYVLRFGLATGADVQLVAAEILQETVVEALAHADTYDVTKQPLAWLIGIALNMIRRRRVFQAKQARYELPLSSLAAQQHEVESESDLLEQLISPGENRLEQEVEMRAQVASLLAMVSQEDRQVIYFALLEDFKRAGLASRLGLSPNTARMRLSRALDRLRSALEQQPSFKGGTYDI